MELVSMVNNFLKSKPGGAHTVDDSLGKLQKTDPDLFPLFLSQIFLKEYLTPHLPPN